MDEHLDGVPSKDLGLQVSLGVEYPLLVGAVGRLDHAVGLRIINGEAACPAERGWSRVNR
jgi:hypothetical protein